MESVGMARGRWQVSFRLVSHLNIIIIIATLLCPIVIIFTHILELLDITIIIIIMGKSASSSFETWPWMRTRDPFFTGAAFHASAGHTLKLVNDMMTWRMITDESFKVLKFGILQLHTIILIIAIFIIIQWLQKRENLVFASELQQVLCANLHISSKGSSIYYVITDRGGGSPQTITDYIMGGGLLRPPKVIM